MGNNKLIIIGAVLMTACNLLVQGPPPPTPEIESPPPASSTPTVISIETLLALPTSTRIATPTSIFILASPRNQPVNCRFGPSIAYAVTGALFIGRQAEVIGKSVDEAWWYVKNPSDPSTNCWLSSDFIDIIGNVESLPVVGPPEIGVNNIQVFVDPVSMNVGCLSFPQTVNLTGVITSNGPTLVTWKWETSAGDEFPEETILFESEGSREVKNLLRVWGANDYRVDIHVLSPNDRRGGTNFKVTCIP